MTSEEFATRFLEEEKVAAVPGSAFGQSGEGYLRKIEDGTASGVRMLRHLLKISEVLNIQISELFIFD